MSPVDQRDLPPQPLPFFRGARWILRRFGQSPGDPLPHLGRGGVGEGDDQQPVDVARILRVENAPDDPLHEYGRFPRSGRGSYENVGASRMNRVPLLLRPRPGGPPVIDAQTQHCTLRQIPVLTLRPVKKPGQRSRLPRSRLQTSLVVEGSM